MSEIKQDGGKPVGEKEFTDGLKRVESRGWITMERNADNDPLWSLTPTGYAEAKFQSR